MTTNVTVEAHCAKEKQVAISIKQNRDGGGASPEQTIIIQDGEKWQGVVYDSRSIAVCEVVSEGKVYVAPLICHRGPISRCRDLNVADEMVAPTFTVRRATS